ncbi:cupin domain-containing protein [Favolaschia claudopus]|uniref:Cupin domain-containing protein n=1 Tax=Favolaschia claudopus TaxID=2862362 RepID=A0AAW0E0N7_9AGAR
MSLPPVRRVVTGHGPDALATFESDALVEVNTRPNGMALSFVAAAPSLPVNNQDPKDWANEEANGRNHEGLPNLFDVPGLSCRVFDVPPGGATPMHRTVTFDLIVMMHGEITITLDGGEQKVLRAGDFLVQKGTSHKWSNEHPTEVARMCVVMTNSLPVKIPGVNGGEEKILGKA